MNVFASNLLSTFTLMRVHPHFQHPPHSQIVRRRFISFLLPPSLSTTFTKNIHNCPSTITTNILSIPSSSQFQFNCRRPTTFFGFKFLLDNKNNNNKHPLFVIMPPKRKTQQQHQRGGVSMGPYFKKSRDGGNTNHHHHHHHHHHHNINNNGARSKRYYAVRYGREGFSGILNTWEECKPYVRGVSKAVFKAFRSLDEARAFIQVGNVLDKNKNSTKTTTTTPSTTPRPETTTTTTTTTMTTTTTTMSGRLNGGATTNTTTNNNNNNNSRLRNVHTTSTVAAHNSNNNNNDSTVPTSPDYSGRRRPYNNNYTRPVITSRPNQQQQQQQQSYSYHLRKQSSSSSNPSGSRHNNKTNTTWTPVDNSKEATELFAPTPAVDLVADSPDSLVEAPKSLVVYTDGACTNNGQRNPRAGYGVYFGPENPYNISASLKENPTNQRAEMTAVLEAMRVTLAHGLVARGGTLTIYTDSQYTKNGILSWMSMWKKNGWKTQGGGMVKNKEIWLSLSESYDALTMKDIKVHLEWVKGHAGIHGNEMADRLACAGIEHF